MLAKTSVGQSSFARPAAVPSSAMQTAETVLDAEVLTMTLYAKNTSEIAYCDYVIEQRNLGNLTNKVLFGAYRYAMKQDESRRFTYFKQALQILCQREGLKLTPFSAEGTVLSVGNAPSNLTAGLPASVLIGNSDSSETQSTILTKAKNVVRMIRRILP